LESGGVIGGTIPGVPVVMVGRSADLGWASHPAIWTTRMFISKR
jgi:acyl-homoserine lactone acylase PvdQ